MSKTSVPTISAIDLFCGAGGLTHGFLRAGIIVRTGIDTDPSCKHAFEFNNRPAEFVQADVETADPAVLSKSYREGEVRVLAGCAPCQPFSRFRHAYTKKLLKNAEGAGISEKDQKWGLLRSFARLVDALDPDIVTMENVPQLCRHTIYDEFKAHLEQRYYVTAQVVDCSRYGIPQRRKRLVLLAAKKAKIVLPGYETYAQIDNSVEAAIGKMGKISAGRSDPNDPLHRARQLTKINLRRIKASKPGGTWHDWDPDLLPECYQKKTGSTFKSVYGRMTWSEPSPVITTQFHNYGTGRFGHPTEDRAISLREGALLQTFPSDYSFVPKDEVVKLTTVGRLIGNAVPPKLSEIIANTIIEHVAKQYVRG